MDLGLKGRIALVTGASTGLGFATARELAAEGALVAIVSRDAVRIEQAAKAIGARAVPFACDLSDPRQRQGLDARVHDRVGLVDILVVNNGGPPPGGFEETENASFAQAVDNHLGAALDLLRAFAPCMRRRGWGRIVAISSCFVKQPGRNMILSNTARAAVAALIKSCASEFGGDGVTANSILPGYTATDRLTALADEMARRAGTAPDMIVAEWTASVPARRLGTPEEFAAAAVFLCSERASFVNGVALSVDGGWNAGLF